MLYIIGDSHSRTFEGPNSPVSEVYWLGAQTALNLWKRNKEIEVFINKNPSAKYFFCLGEIDCRIHIYDKSMKYGLPEYFLATNTVDVYVSYVAYLKRLYDVSIMSVPPQGVQNNIYGYEYYAKREKRQEITDLFNTWLQTKCWDSRVPFVDIWYNKSEMVRPLYPSTAFKEDECHIKNSIAIEKLEAWLA